MKNRRSFCPYLIVLFGLAGTSVLIFLVLKRGWRGVLTAIAAVAGFYAVQHWGLFRLITTLISKLTSSSSWQGLVDHGEALDEQVRALYARRRAIVISGALSLLSWHVGAIEVWIALWAMGL